MDDVTIIEVLDLSAVESDRLLVRGTDPAVVDEQGQPVILEARGWLSALTNHYSPDAYGADGHRVEGARPRAMTPAESVAYLRGLLVVQNRALFPSEHPAARTGTPLDLAVLGVAGDEG